MKRSPAMLALIFIAVCGVIALVIDLGFDERHRRMGKVEERSIIEQKRLTAPEDPDGVNMHLGGPAGIDTSMALTPAPATRPPLFSSDTDVLSIRTPQNASTRPQ